VAVVALVVVVLAAVLIPAIGTWLEHYRLGIAGQQVADALQAAKLQAVSKTRRVELLFDVNGNRLGQEGATLVDLPPGVRFAVPETSVAPDVGVAMTEPVTFPALSETGGLKAAAFTGRGLPDVDPGDVYAVYLANSAGSTAVLMTSAGNVRVMTWDGERWK
jgi:hypothetical protein